MPQASLKSVTLVMTGGTAGGRRSSSSGRRRSRKKQSEASPARSGDESSPSVLQSTKAGDAPATSNERWMPKMKKSSFLTKESKKNRRESGKTSKSRRSKRSSSGKGGNDSNEAQEVRRSRKSDRSKSISRKSVNSTSGSSSDSSGRRRAKSELAEMARSSQTQSGQDMAVPQTEGTTAYQSAAACKSMPSLGINARSLVKPDADVVSPTGCTGLVSPHALKIAPLVKSLSKSAVSNSIELVEIGAEIGDMIVEDLATQTDYLVEELFNFFDPGDPSDGDK